MNQATTPFTLTNSPASQKQPTATLSGLRVAVIQFWLSGYGGTERVLEAIGEIFPQADYYALVVANNAIPPGLRARGVKTSFVARIPGAKRWFRHLLPLYPLALEQFDLHGYDLVISSESGPAKGVITSPRSCHLCYCHTPMRYLWDMYHEYRKTMNPVTRAIFTATAHYLRQWDVSTAARVDSFAANSEYVATRIRKYYRRESTVIHPPVDVSAGYISREIEDYYLAVSRLVPYKRIDLAIEACNRLGRQLYVVGTGPEYQRLRKLAGPTIKFLGRLDEKSLPEIYARCRALLFPAEEDFGLVPVEAQSYGRPVIAYGRGGALETVVGLRPKEPVEGATGMFFNEQTADALAQSIMAFEKIEKSFDPEFIRDCSLRFSKDGFKEKFAKFAVKQLTRAKKSISEFSSEEN